MTTPAGAEAARRRYGSHQGTLRSPKALGKILPRIKHFRGRLAVAAVCLVVAATVGLAFPQVVRHLLDAAFERHDRRLLDPVALGLVALFALQGG